MGTIDNFAVDFVKCGNFIKMTIFLNKANSRPLWFKISRMVQYGNIQ